MKINGIECTPNPSALKFLLDQPALEAGSAQFDSAQSAPEIICEIFEIENVESVFFLENFMTISVSGPVDWPAVRERLDGLLESRSAPLIKTVQEGEAPSELEKINKLMDLYIRPALAGDGGGIEIVKMEDDNLFIHYQGACGTCPTAISGTLFSIQHLLRTELGREIVVIPT